MVPSSEGLERRMSNVRVGLMVALCGLLLSGCGEVVTGAKPTATTTLHVEVQLSSAYSSGAYRYLLIYGKQAQATAGKSYYQFVPGESGVDSATGFVPEAGVTTGVRIQYYYQTYFSTWSDIFVLDSSAQVNWVYPSGNVFPVTADMTSHSAFLTSGTLVAPDSSIMTWGNSISYSGGIYVDLALSRLKNPPNAGDIMVLTILTLDPASHRIMDSLSIQVTNQLGEPVLGSGATDVGVAGNLDLLAWKVRVL